MLPARRPIVMLAAVALAAACTAEVDAPPADAPRATPPPERERTPEPAKREREGAPPTIDPVDLPAGDVAPSPGCPVEQPFMCRITTDRFECRARACPASCLRTGCPATFVCADCGSGPTCVRSACR